MSVHLSSILSKVCSHVCLLLEYTLLFFNIKYMALLPRLVLSIILRLKGTLRKLLRVKSVISVNLYCIIVYELNFNF